MIRAILTSAILFCASIVSSIASETPPPPDKQSGMPPLPVKQYNTPEERRAVKAYFGQTKTYQRALSKHQRKTKQYWTKISSVRTARRRKRARGGKIKLSDYVLDQPPEYTGPPAPILPPFLKQLKRVEKPDAGKSSSLPMVPDFMRYAKRHFGFSPGLPIDEKDYKLAYAWTALENGITKDQAVRIYGFEASGNGTYDVQAGLESKEAIAAGRKPISTALGYNQLLAANTIGLVSKYGRRILKELQDRRAKSKGKRLKELKQKIAGLRKMVKYARSMPYRWSRHVRASRSSKGRALHALILDVDIGPLLQTQKLVNSIDFAKRLGYDKSLSAAELEMLNLTGDGNGFDMISLSQSMREKVPTANFFQQNGYERNPVARKNNTVADLLAATNRKMDYHTALDGGRQMAEAFDTLIKKRQSENDETSSANAVP